MDSLFTFVEMDILFSSYILPLVLAFIMFGMGATLTFDNFRYLFKYPKGLITGLVGQMILLPLLALLIAYLAPINPLFKIGLVLVASCPGGASSNLIVHLLKGNVAMSISFSAINSFLTLFSISFWMNLALIMFSDDSVAIEMDAWDTMEHIFLVVLLPAILGMLFNKYYFTLARRLDRIMNIAMPVLLGIAMIGAVFIDKKADTPISLDLILHIFPWVFLLNVVGLLGAYLLSRLFQLGNRNSTTISLEVGMQNTGLAIYIATSPAMLNSTDAAIPAAVYALFTFFTAVAWGIFLRRKWVIRQIFPKKKSN